MIRYFKREQETDKCGLKEVAKCGKVSRDLSLKLPFEKGSF